MFDKVLELAAQFWETLLPWIVIAEYEGGVVLRLGRFRRTIGPGLSWKIPVADHVLITHTAVTTMELRAQTLTTRDDKAVVVSAIVKYRIRNVKPFLLEIGDAADVLKDVTMGAIKDAINNAPYADIYGAAKIEDRVLDMVRREVNQYGFQIFKVTFADQGRVRSFRMIGDNPRVQQQEH